MAFPRPEVLFQSLPSIFTHELNKIPSCIQLLATIKLRTLNITHERKAKGHEMINENNIYQKKIFKKGPFTINLTLHAHFSPKSFLNLTKSFIIFDI